MPGFGAGSFGIVLFGGAPPAQFQLARALAARENVVRLQFTAAPYYSGILDPYDASNPDAYTTLAIAGTVGLNGEAAHAVNVVRVELTPAAEVVLLPPISVGGVERASVYGEVLDAYLDRPMTPYSAQYQINLDALNLATTVIVPGFGVALDPTMCSYVFDAVANTIQPAFVSPPIPSRDIANPQTRDSMMGSVPNPDDPLNLGGLVVDDTGDYAFDEGLTSFKKRVLRRLVTRKGAYAHMPDYGVGVPTYGKKLAQQAVLRQIADEAQKQISREPETAKVSVRGYLDPRFPGYVRFDIKIRTITGSGFSYSVPFAAA